MQDTVTAKDLAQALGISERSVWARASKEDWPFEAVSCRGGKRRLYPVRSLPEDVRQAHRRRHVGGESRTGHPARRFLPLCTRDGDSIHAAEAALK